MKHSLAFLLLLGCFAASAQSNDRFFNVKEVSRIENVLASDDMRGRKVGTPDIDRAADFIQSEFRKAHLKPFQGNSFLQEFYMVKPKEVSSSAVADGAPVDHKRFVIITSLPEVSVNENAGYQVEQVRASDNFSGKITALLHANKNLLVVVDTSFERNFGRLAFLRSMIVKSPYTIVFLLAANVPSSFSITETNTISETRMANVVGILPGKSRKNEYVIFSGHYDHLGVGKPEGTDSIYNGANDDAAGTTAVIMLARYYAKQHNNERTLVFAAFTAEEIGEYGSQYFSSQFNPGQVAAMFNIEMIGTESKWGRNSAYITGYERTNMGQILQQNLKGTDFNFYPDPYTTQNLFYRSDNASLARQGVPAHTISTSKMDNEPNYHRVSDEVKTLDMENMAAIIRSIALSAQTIVSGKDTPSRVDPGGLK
jgi:Peptidase family M28